MAISNQLLTFGPDPDALIRTLAPRVTDEMLGQIAALDCGMDADRHASALTQIRDKLIFPERAQWYPDEVLLLALGGSFPNYSGSLGELTAAEQDICTAFVAACVLRRLGEPECARLAGWLLRASGQLAVLSFCLEDWPCSESASLFAWLLPRIPDHNDQRPFLAVGLIHLAIEGRLDALSETLDALADWIFAEEERLLADMVPGSGTLYRRHQPRIWRAVGKRLSTHELSHLPAPLQSKIDEIAEILA
jgi:hypothetical protein